MVYVLRYNYYWASQVHCNTLENETLGIHFLRVVILTLKWQQQTLFLWISSWLLLVLCQQLSNVVMEAVFIEQFRFCTCVCHKWLSLQKVRRYKQTEMSRWEMVGLLNIAGIVLIVLKYCNHNCHLFSDLMHSNDYQGGNHNGGCLGYWSQSSWDDKGGIFDFFKQNILKITKN